MSPNRQKRYDTYKRIGEAISRHAERGYDGSYVFDIKGRPSQDPELKTSDGTGPKMKTLQWEPRRLGGEEN